MTGDADIAGLGLEIDFSQVDRATAALERMGAVGAKTGVTFNEFESDLGLIDKGLIKATADYESGAIAVQQYLNRVKELNAALQAEVANVGSGKSLAFQSQVGGLQSALSGANAQGLKDITAEAGNAEANLLRMSRATERGAIGLVNFSTAAGSGTRGLQAMGYSAMMLTSGTGLAPLIAMITVGIALFEAYKRAVDNAAKSDEKAAEAAKKHHDELAKLIVERQHSLEFEISLALGRAKVIEAALPRELALAAAQEQQLATAQAAAALAIGQQGGGDYGRAQEIKQLQEAAKFSREHADAMALDAKTLEDNAIASRHNLATNQAETAAQREAAQAVKDHAKAVEEAEKIESRFTDAMDRLAADQRRAHEDMVRQILTERGLLYDSAAVAQTLADKMAAVERQKQDALEATNHKILEQEKALTRLLEATQKFGSDGIGAQLGGAGIGKDGSGFGFNMTGGNPLSDVLRSIPGAAQAFGFMRSFVDNIFAAGRAAQIAADQIAQLTATWNKSLTTFYSRADGTDQGLAGRIAQARAEADALRQAGLAAHQTEGALAGIDYALAKYIQRLKDEVAAHNLASQDDYHIRLLRAQGLSDQADALALATAQQREYNQAMKDGADDVTMHALEEAQLAETHAYAAGKIQSVITGLTSTIANLEQFKVQLGLNSTLTTLSPIQQLAEARRQYDAVVAAARTGDQAAAGNLPAVAQAFLQASRSVNASSLAYVADFNRVQADTDAVTQIFKDQRTIQQSMLDKLNGIDDSGRLQIEITRLGFTEVSSKLDAVGDVADKLDVLTRRFDALTARL